MQSKEREKQKFHLTWRLCSSKPRKVESFTERRDLLWWNCPTLLPERVPDGKVGKFWFLSRNVFRPGFFSRLIKRTSGREGSPSRVGKFLVDGKTGKMLDALCTRRTTPSGFDNRDGALFFQLFLRMWRGGKSFVEKEIDFFFLSAAAAARVYSARSKVCTLLNKRVFFFQTEDWVVSVWRNKLNWIRWRSLDKHGTIANRCKLIVKKLNIGLVLMFNSSTKLKKNGKTNLLYFGCISIDNLSISIEPVVHYIKI